MHLSDYSARGRDNNFNALRMIAALMVLITHSFAIVAGTSEAEPFQEQLGMTIGNIAVDVFFITSGFLITASLMSKQHIFRFIVARLLRIYPALLVMLGITIVVLGPMFTSLAFVEYITHSDTIYYLIKNITLVMGVAYVLPEVFSSNPYEHAVNGSLWSLPHEVRMYMLIAFIWYIFTSLSRYNSIIKDYSELGFKLTVISIALVSFLLLVYCHFNASVQASFSVKLCFMFFCGATYYLLKQKIQLSSRLFITVIVMLCLSLFNTQFFYIIYLLCIAYVVLYLAYIPTGTKRVLRQYNRVGDYSYGMYIYAFPVQQSLIAVIPDISLIMMIIFSSLISLVFAMLSWHLVEIRALSLRNKA